MNLNFKILLHTLSAISVFFGALSVNAQDLSFRQIAVDSQNVWVATSSGLYKYDKQNGSYKLFTDNSHTNLTCVAITPDGEVTVGAYGKDGIANFSNDKFTPITVNPQLQNVTALLYADSQLWVGSSQFISYYSDSEWQFNPTPNPTASYYQVSSMKYDKTNNRIWFGIQASPSTKTFGYITPDCSTTTVSGIECNVNDLCILPSGKILLATDEGMKTYENGSISFLEHPTSLIPQKCNVVANQDEKYWFAAGNIMVEANGNSFTRHQCSNATLPTDIITSIVPDGDTVWVTLQNGGLYKFTNGIFESTSGITEILNDELNNTAPIYNLNGHVVENPTKGQIWIQEGRKILVTE